MDDRGAAIGLARLAQILRAEAANGLYWGADDDELMRLRRLRAHAAVLLAEVDPRPLESIRAVFEADRGLRTPTPGVELRIRCADGETLVRRHRMRAEDGSLGQVLGAAAAKLRTSAPERVVGIADTDRAGLPCPHTYLLVYELDSPLASMEARSVIGPGDRDLEGRIDSLAAEAVSETSDRPPLPVSSNAVNVLHEVVAQCEESRSSTSNFYELERQHRIESWCRGTVESDVSYPVLHCGDIAHQCLSTGADAAIFDDRDRLLLIRRTDTGQWAMPGGAAEVGETVGAAAVREAFEETGLDVSLTGLAWAFDNRDARHANSRMAMIMSFSARVDDPGQPIRLAELEASDSRWVTEDEIDGIDFFIGHERRVPAAFADRAARARTEADPR